MLIAQVQSAIELVNMTGPQPSNGMVERLIEKTLKVNINQIGFIEQTKRQAYIEYGDNAFYSLAVIQGHQLWLSVDEIKLIEEKISEIYEC